MTAQLQTHVSIDTADLAASTAFYRALLGREPALERHDYVRFDVDLPPLVLGLNAVAGPLAAATGPLEHLGIRFDQQGELEAARRRLGALAAVDDEPQAECCYARLERSWVRDPSGVQWELFLVREPVVEAATRAGRDAGTCCEPDCCATLER